MNEMIENISISFVARVMEPVSATPMAVPVIHAWAMFSLVITYLIAGVRFPGRLYILDSMIPTVKATM